MAVVKILAFDVINGKETEFERGFPAARVKMAHVPGLLTIELLRPVAGETRYLIYTRWGTEEAAQSWLTQFLPPSPDGTGLIKEARAPAHPEPVPPLTANSVKPTAPPPVQVHNRTRVQAARVRRRVNAPNPDHLQEPPDAPTARTTPRVNLRFVECSPGRSSWMVGPSLHRTYREAYDAGRGLFFFSITWGFE